MRLTEGIHIVSIGMITRLGVHRAGRRAIAFALRAMTDAAILLIEGAPGSDICCQECSWLSEMDQETKRHQAQRAEAWHTHHRIS